MFVKEYAQVCERLHNLTRIPMVLADHRGGILGIWPQMPEGYIEARVMELVLADFRLQKRDALHPLISYIEPGYFLGVAELSADVFAIIGLVSPFQHSRHEILEICAGVIAPPCLQQFCDMMQLQPLVELYQLKDFICLLVQLTQGEMIPSENVLFNDFTRNENDSEYKLAQGLFDQREEADFHVPTDYETAICGAIEAGDPALLQKCLHAPAQGRVGRMSSSELRQHKYELISLATLISRAAIRGGLSAETAFNLSDIYCQRADVLTDIEAVQRLAYTMMLDFCDKVGELHSGPSVTPLIQKCKEYISVHLHEPIRLETLSEHCGLCTRSLSLRFKKEVGMGVPEYIHREKLREAQYLLRHTDNTLSEITLYLNYPSQSYFTQIFKKYLGKTPQQYRDATNR